MASIRKGKDFRCDEWDVYVNGIKVATHPYSNQVVFLRGDKLVQLTAKNYRRMLKGENGATQVIVAPWTTPIQPQWFTNTAADTANLQGTTVWQGTISATTAKGGRGRRNNDSIRTWDLRNMLAACHHIAGQPDPHRPDQKLLAHAALAAAEARGVRADRQHGMLQALLRAGAPELDDRLADLRRLQGLQPDQAGVGTTDSRKVLRRRATRMLHRDQAVTRRLADVARYDQRGGALTVAVTASRVTADRLAKLTIAAGTAGAIMSIAQGLAPDPATARTWVRYALGAGTFARAAARIHLYTSESRGAGRDATPTGGKAHHADIRTETATHDLAMDVILGAGPENILVDVSDEVPGGRDRPISSTLADVMRGTAKNINETVTGTLSALRHRDLYALTAATITTYGLLTISEELDSAVIGHLPLNDIGKQALGVPVAEVLSRAAGKLADPARNVRKAARQQRRTTTHERRQDAKLEREIIDLLCTHTEGPMTYTRVGTRTVLHHAGPELTDDEISAYEQAGVPVRRNWKRRA